MLTVRIAFLQTVAIICIKSEQKKFFDLQSLVSIRKLSCWWVRPSIQLPPLHVVVVWSKKAGFKDTRSSRPVVHVCRYGVILLLPAHEPHHS
jgi:hypothetical protein